MGVSQEEAADDEGDGGDGDGVVEAGIDVAGGSAYEEAEEG